MALHPKCEECILARKARYGADYDKVRCTGIQLDPLDSFDTTGMSDEEKDSLRDLLDPWRWGMKEFGLNPRDYQELMARCTAIKKVFRLGRRSGKTEVLVLSALHKMFTIAKKKVLLFTPYENQIKLFRQRIEMWKDRSPSFNASVTAFRSDPLSLELGNGSSLYGFTTGVKAGQKADSSRGQEADIIIIDEADLLTADDIVTIIPMLQRTDEKSTEEKELWVASTPTGKHDFFYNWANSPRYKEFHYSSMASPAWGVDSEAEFKEMFPTQIAWEHEILADWGEETEGVYKHSYIDRARDLAKKYFPTEGIWDYKKQVPKAQCIYIIGVDWNSSNNGVQIVVSEYDSSRISPEDVKDNIQGRIRIATREDIDAKEFTQTKAIQKIIELNNRWNPAYIYVDQGYGHVQIEDLRRYGHKHPETQILNRLKPIDFSSTQEVRDPVTKAPVKKAMKPFLVHNSINFFERNIIILNRNDKEFEKQLRDYTVAKRTAEGREVYSAGNDHILDAFNLSLLAYTLEFTDLGRPIFTTAMRVVGPMGERRTEQINDGGDIKIIDKQKTQKDIITPRQIPMSDSEGRRMSRDWKNNKYNKSRSSRPIKRTI